MKTTANRLLYLFMLICILTSCSSYNSMKNVDSNVKKLNLGMSKEQVILIMGNEYEVVNSKDGAFTLGYKSWDNGIYKLLFIDGKLKEWNKEWFKGDYIIKDGSNKTTGYLNNNSGTKDHLDAHRNAMLSSASSN